MEPRPGENHPGKSTDLVTPGPALHAVRWPLAEDRFAFT